MASNEIVLYELGILATTSIISPIQIDFINLTLRKRNRNMPLSLLQLKTKTNELETKTLLIKTKNIGIKIIFPDPIIKPIDLTTKILQFTTITLQLLTANVKKSCNYPYIIAKLRQ